MINSLLIKLISFYKLAISPFLLPCCRFSPPCSSFAISSIYKYGVIRGGYISIKRLLRCNPFFDGGYDPVP